MKLDGKSKVIVATATSGELKKYPMLVGNAVIVSTRVLTGGWFTSAVVEQLDETIIQRPVKSGDFDNYNHHEVKLLASNGIVPLGTRVKLNTPLAIGLPMPDSSLTPEEKVLRAIFGEKVETPRALLMSSLLDEALVVRSDVTGKTALKVGIDLLIKRPLSIGDVLEDNRGNRFVVAAFSDKGRLSPKWDNIDILVHPVTALWLKEPYMNQSDKVVSHYSTVKFTKVTRQREDKLASRAIGAYTLLTQAPIDHQPNPGQKVNIGSVALAGYVANAKEMLTVKCDAIEERAKAYKALISGDTVPSTGISEAEHRFFHLLQGLGFAVTLNGNQLGILRLTDKELKKLSHGEVTKPDTINFSTFKPDKGGILCEQIFGPVKDYECACGKYRGRKHKGAVCCQCGVEVIMSRVRRTRFGHITLAVPVVHPFFIKLLPSLLGLTEDRVRAIVSYDEMIEVGGEDKTGSMAITDLLKKRSIDPQPFLMGVLPVMPPGLRPIVKLDNGKYASSDVNDLYRRIINRNIRTRKMVELSAPLRIQQNEQGMLQNAITGLMANTTLKGSNDRVLRSLDGEFGSLLDDMFTKRCDYSAKATCIPDPTLPKETLGVPDMILLDIFRPMILKVLEDRKIVETVRQACDLIETSPGGQEILGALDTVINGYPVLAMVDGVIGNFGIARRQGEAICVNPSDAQEFGITFSGEYLSIHVPISEEAKIEAMASPNPRNDMASNLSRLTTEKLVEHAMAKAPFELGLLDQLVFSAK